MLTALLDFAGLLRRAGLPVSTGEVLDATAALDAAGVERAAVRAALRATLVKRAGDLATFDDLFELYWGAADPAAAIAPPSLGALMTAAGVDEARARALLAELQARAAGLGPLGRLATGAAAPELGPELRAAAARVGLERIESPLQAGAFSFRILDALGVREMEAALGALIGLMSPGASIGEAAALRELVGGQIGRLRQAVRRFVDDELRRQRPDHAQRLAEAALAEQPLARLTPREIEQLEAEVDRLARRLARRVRRRERRPRRGRLDLRRTLRTALGTSGVPFQVRFHRRPRRPPRLVVLCDISDSVRAVAGFFLHLVYALQKRWERIQTFAFVADVGELTELFARAEKGRAIELALGGAVVSPWTNSDYGRALDRFHARWAGRIGSRTTVLILGDARTNFQPPRAAVLGDLRRRAHRVLWLNPEPPAAWGWGDSAMAAYAPHCDRVLTVWNLASLRAAVEEIAG